MRLLIAIVGLALAATAHADDFDDYGTAQGSTQEVSFPTIQSGFVAVVDQFPPTAGEQIGNFPVDGLSLVAMDQTLYLQKNHGASAFIPVGTTQGVMDPAFVRISPDGTKIALGLGFAQDLLVIPTSALDTTNPPVLDTAPGVQAYPINYQEGEWLGNDLLVLTGGLWSCGQGIPCISGIGAIDTSVPNDPGGALIQNIPGASGAIGIDPFGNLVTGLGFAPPGQTGEIRYFSSAQVFNALGTGTPLDYGVDGALLASNVLSASSLGFDAEGNVHIGGGDAFGGGAGTETGYAAVIEASVVARVAGGGAPVDEGNGSEYKELAPDSCEDDPATGAIYNSWGASLGVLWNPTTVDGGSCTAAGQDFWGPGVTPRFTMYFPAGAPDQDGDGIPDSADNAFFTPNPGQEDFDGDGTGNVADADLNNDGFVDLADFFDFASSYLEAPSPGNEDRDMNGDGFVDLGDYFLFRPRWLTAEPWF